MAAPCPRPPPGRWLHCVLITCNPCAQSSVSPSLQGRAWLRWHLRAHNPQGCVDSDQSFRTTSPPTFPPLPASEAESLQWRERPRCRDAEMQRDRGTWKDSNADKIRNESSFCSETARSWPQTNTASLTEQQLPLSNWGMDAWGFLVILGFLLYI